MSETSEELLSLLLRWSQHEPAKCSRIPTKKEGLEIPREEWLWLQHAIQRAIASHNWPSILKHSNEKGYQAFIYFNHAIPSGIGGHETEPAIALLKAYIEALEVEASAQVEEVEVLA